MIKYSLDLRYHSNGLLARTLATFDNIEEAYKALDNYKYYCDTLYLEVNTFRT